MIVVVIAALLSLPAQAVPADWSCDPERYADGQCDCGCTAFDDADCEDPLFTACDRSNCLDATVPWAEHNPGCMQGTCGDGWTADDEACDDDAGCAEDCGSVEVGFFCGPRADGCADSGAVIEEPDGNDDGDDGSDNDGCAAGVGLPSVLAMLGLVRRRRR